ncbi:unnamed protein product [Parajaminaea phylloscopi]
MKDPVFPVAAGAGALLVLLPLSWHLNARNWAMLLLIWWIFVANIVQFINSLVWWNKTDNCAPIWCDISTRLYIMSTMGVPCATWSIAIRLESIASTRSAVQSRGLLKKRALLELTLCVLVPVLYAVCAIVWQGHRFDIYEGMGCYTAAYLSVPWLLLSPIPILIASIGSLIFSTLAFRWFLLRRRQFLAVLVSSGSRLDQSRYLRMMAFCSVDMLLTVPFTVINLTLLLRESNGTLKPYTSWSDVHFDFGTVLPIPASAFGTEVPASSFHRFNMTRWSAPIASFVFFALFGMTQDAMQEYRRVYRAISRHAQHRIMPRQGIAEGDSSCNGQSPNYELQPALPTPTLAKSSCLDRSSHGRNSFDQIHSVMVKTEHEVLY